MRANFCRGVSFLLALVALQPSLVSAQALPPNDVFVYVDYSRSIFTLTPDAPSGRIVEMLGSTFDFPIDGGRRPFLSGGDALSIYLFGNEVQTIAEGIDGGNQSEWRARLNSLNEQQSPSSLTNLETLFRHIATNPAISNRADGRPKIVLIASDLVHDPRNSSTDVCGAVQAGSSPAQDEVRSLASFVQPAGPADYPVFFGVLDVRPDDAYINGIRSTRYRECYREALNARLLQPVLEQSLDASLISYAEVRDNVGSFAERIVNAVYERNLPPLVVEGGEVRRQGDEYVASVRIRNPGRLDNRLAALRFLTSPEGPPVYTFTYESPVQVPQEGQDTFRDIRIEGPAATQVARSVSLFASAQSQSPPGAPPSPPVLLTKEGEPLNLTDAAADRDRVTQPFQVAIAVENPGNLAKRLLGVVYYRAVQGGTPVIGDAGPLSGKRVEPGGDERLEEVNLPASLATDLFSDTGVFVAVRFQDDDGSVRGAERETDRRRIETTDPTAALTILNIAHDNRPAATRPEIAITLNNPSDERMGAGRIFFYRSQRDQEDVREQTIIGARTIPPNGADVIRVALDDEDVRALTTGRGLAVAVVDDRFGFPSDRVAVPPPDFDPLQINEADFEVVGPSLFNLRLEVSNNNLAHADIQRIQFFDLGNNLIQEIDLTALTGSDEEAVLPRVRSRARQDILIPISEAAAPDVFNETDVRLVLVDSLAGAGDPTSRRTPAPEPLRVADSVEEVRGEDGARQLQFTVRNPGNRSNTLRRITVRPTGQGMRGAVELPLVGPVTIPAGQQLVTVTVPFGPTISAQFQGGQELQLVLHDDVQRWEPARTPPDKPFTLDPDPPLQIEDDHSWLLDFSPPQIQLQIGNSGQFKQNLERILFKVEEDGPTTGFDLPTHVAVPGGGTSDMTTVLVPFGPDRQRALLLEPAFLACAVRAGDNGCEGVWVQIPSPPKQPLILREAREDPVLDRHIRFNLWNAANLINQATEIRVWPAADGTDPATLQPQPMPIPGGPIVLLPGADRDIGIRLSEAEWQRYYPDLTANVVVVDQSTPTPSADQAQLVPLELFDIQINDISFYDIPSLEPWYRVNGSVEIARTSNANLQSARFERFLTSPADRTITPAITEVVAFGTDREAVVHFVWETGRELDEGTSLRFQPAHEINRPEGAAPPPTPIEFWWRALPWYMAAIIILILATFFLTMWLLKGRGFAHSKILKRVTIQSMGRFIHTFTHYSSGFFGAPVIVGAMAVLTYIHNWIGGLAIQLVGLICAVLVSSLVAHFMAWRLNESLKRAISSAEQKELQLVISEYHGSTLLILFLTTAIFSVIAISIYWVFGFLPVQPDHF